MKTRVLAAFAVLSLALLAVAQESSAPASRRVSNPADSDWKASGSLPPGAEYILIYEDPRTHGVQTLVRMPKGYALPKHSHASDETILALKGKIVLEFADKTETLTAGGYAAIPAGTEFALKAGGFGGAEFLMILGGPFDMKGMDKPKP